MRSAAAGRTSISSSLGVHGDPRAHAARGVPLAGEMSGHIFFNDRWTGFDDALYVAVRTLAVLGQTGESLAAFRRRLPTVVSTPELRIPCPDDRKGAVVRNIAARLRGTGAEMDENRWHPSA